MSCDLYLFRARAAADGPHPSLVEALGMSVGG